MCDLAKNEEVNKLKEIIKAVEEERDEVKAALHIMTVHCCNIISKYEGGKVEEIRKELDECMHRLVHN